MRGKSSLAAMVLVVATLAVLPQTLPLRNAGFEDGWDRDTTYYVYPNPEELHTEFGEIFTPRKWTTWWVERRPCPGDTTKLTGRPEVRLTTDPGRVYAGDQAVMLFTYYRCHVHGLYQEVSSVDGRRPLEPGTPVEFCGYAHSWYSDCDHHYEYPLPLEKDCTTHIRWAQDYLQVGIDPDGGFDLDEVVWSTPPVQQYGTYGDKLCVRATITGTRATLVFRSITTHSLEHEDNYFEATTFRELTFLPCIYREAL